MKIAVHIILVFKRSDMKFEGENQFRKYVKNDQKLGPTLNLPGFGIIFNIFVRFWHTQPKNKHNNFL